MDSPPFRSDIFYSVQNEDYRTELALLRRLERGAPLRVLLIASSGENALSLLAHAMVGAVYAVEVNPAQLALCELRRAALERLTRGEQLRLLGATPGDAVTRLALFERVRPGLPEAVRAFWDERRDRELAFGVQHAGRNDVGMAQIARALREADFDPLKLPLQEADLERWTAVYRQVMTPEYIGDLFGLASGELAAKIAGIAGYLGECHFRALRQPGAEGNYFLTTVFAGRYAPGEAGLPLYLQEAGQAALRRLGTRDRLHLHRGNLLEVMQPLADAHGRFDLISISNIADWMTEGQFAATVEQARACLDPGGALLARVAPGSRMIVAVMGRTLRVDEAVNTELAQAERGPWFRTVAAGFAS